MSDWKEYKLGELIKDIAAGPFGSNLKVECFVESGFPIIDGANLKGIKVTDNITKYVTEKKARSLHRAIAKRNDIVVTISGNVGQIAYIPDNSKYLEYLVSQRQFRATFDVTKVDVPFLVYYFHTRVGQHKILSFANQVGVPALAQPIKNFKEIELELPPINEQKRIARVLGSLDDKIDLLRRENATLEAMAETLFRQWFVEEAKEEWEERPLKDVVDIAIGRTPPRKESKWFSTNPNNIKWLSIKDMGGDSVFLFNTSEYLTKEAVEVFSIPIIPKNTVVLSFKMTVGRVGITTEDMLSNEAIAHFKFMDNTPFTKEYLYLFLKSFRYDTLGSTSSIVTAINSAMIKNMEIPIPDTDTMERYRNQTQPMFDKIYSNQEQINTIIQTRDGLLPRLMGGGDNVIKTCQK